MTILTDKETRKLQAELKRTDDHNRADEIIWLLNESARLKRNKLKVVRDE